MSNQPEKIDLPQHKPGSPCKNWWLPTTSQLHFFALHNLYLRPFYTMAAGSCPAAPKLQFLRKHCWHQMEQHRRTSFEPCREICNSGTCAISKTTMVASKTRNTITALRRLHSKQMRLVMKCQINHENSQIFRNTNLDPLEKTGGYLQLPTSPLCIILDHRSW